MVVKVLTKIDAILPLDIELRRIQPPILLGDINFAVEELQVRTKKLAIKLLRFESLRRGIFNQGM